MNHAHDLAAAPMPSDLLALRLAPTALGRLAGPRRRPGTIAIEDVPAHAWPVRAVTLRDGTTTVHDQWPTSPSAHDRVVLSVRDDDDDRRAYLEWLAHVATGPAFAVAPVGEGPAGLHRLWCLGAARLVLPADFAVHVRHDLVGIRFAQLGLGVGADTLAGPVAPERHLPLAGLPRPTESTHAALVALIRHAGLRPALVAEEPAP